MNIHPVLRLFLKIGLFFAPLLLLLAINIKNIQSPEKVQQSLLEDKIERLVVQASTSPQVIIGGESRAEKGIVTNTFMQKTGLRAANVAVGFGTLAQAYDTFKADDILGGNKLIIISVSSYEINDQVLANQLQVKKAADKEPFGIQKMLDLYHYYITELTYYAGNLKNLIRKDRMGLSRMDTETFEKGGYSEGTGVLRPLPEGTKDTANPWYTNVKTGGDQEKDFLRGIKGFGDSNNTVIVYLGPIAPSWRQELAGTNGPDVEEHFRDVVRESIASYPNMHFIDFSSSDIPALTDMQFADSVHLNDDGATKFTSIFVNALHAEKIIP